MLASKSRDWHRSVSSPLALALTVSLCAQALFSGPAQALSFISAKKSQLQTPMEAKLDDDSGPAADTASAPAADSSSSSSSSASDTTSGAVADVKASAAEKTKTKDSSASRENSKNSKKETAKETAKKDEPVSLAPLSLSDAEPSDAGAATSQNSDESAKNEPDSAANNDKQYMKLHAETMGVAPKGPLDGDGGGAPTTLPSKSLKSEIAPGKGRLVDQASSVNLSPMALMDTDAEADQKTITDLDCERAQISDLWEATLTRSQDIQFVVQKLMPSSDKSHTTTALMRMISSTLVSGVSAAAMMSPSPMTYASTQAGSQMIMNIMGMADAKAARKAQIDQGQAITLYKMVRETADNLTEKYRDYKKYVRRIDRAQTTTAELQNMIQEARAGQDAAKQIEMEYTLAKSKGDIEEAVYDARRYRQSLIDLAGVEAVNKLDQALQDQLIAEKELDKKTQIAQKVDEPASKAKEKTRDALKKLNNMVQPEQAKNSSM